MGNFCLKTEKNKEIPPLLFNITITPGSPSDLLEAREGSWLVRNYIHMWYQGHAPIMPIRGPRRAHTSAGPGIHEEGWLEKEGSPSEPANAGLF